MESECESKDLADQRRARTCEMANALRLTS